MSRAYSCLVAVSMAVGIHALAAPEITPRAVLAQRQQDCPYVSLKYADDTTSINACCVGGSNAGQQPFLSVCEGWPICDGPTTTTWTATPISCAALVAFTDANYDAELSSAEAAFSAHPNSFCYTEGAANNCAGGAVAAATATTTSDASSAEESGNGANGADGGDAAATGGDAAATGGTAVGNAGSAGSAVNSGDAASNTGVSVSGSSGNGSSSSSSGSSGSSSSSSGTTGSGSSSSGGESSSTTTTTNTTTHTDESGANILVMGWGAWTLGLVGAAPVLMAVML